MAVKQRRRKKNAKQELFAKAVKIKCCYCDKKNICVYQVRKEKSEELGYTTYCTLTPNIPKKQRKRIKR